MKCKVCNAETIQSEHPNFAKCGSCGCYSNVLDNPLQENLDLYETAYADLSIWAARRKSDAKHWNKVFNKFKDTLPGNAVRIVDLAGGIGLASSVMQGIMGIPVTLVDRSLSLQNAKLYDDNFDNKVIKADVFDYLKSIEISKSPHFVINSHIIEHFEIEAAREFFRLIKQKFPSSTLLTYCPCAGAAKNEKLFLHFNTGVPSEHRIVWSRPAIDSLIKESGVDVTHSCDVDLDIYIIGQL